MAIYQDDGNEQNGGMSVFLRDEPDRPEAATVAPAEPQSPGNGSAITSILVAVLAIVVAGGAAAAWFVFQPEVDLNLRTPVAETYPYTETVAYAGEFDSLQKMLGDELTVTDAGDTVVEWDISGEGYAEVHLMVEGEHGKGQIWVDWIRDRDTWKVQAARYALDGGTQSGIPIGQGTFLSQEDLETWRRADPETLLGRGQREYVQGHHMQAIELFSKALAEAEEQTEDTDEKDPDDLEALYWRGRAFEALNNSPKALADYQRLLTENPEHPQALARLDAMRASPPPGQPTVETPDLEDKSSKSVSPVSLIPR